LECSALVEINTPRLLLVYDLVENTMSRNWANASVAWPEPAVSYLQKRTRVGRAIPPPSPFDMCAPAELCRQR